MLRMRALGMGVALLWAPMAHAVEPTPPPDWSRSAFYGGVAGVVAIQNYQLGGTPNINGRDSFGVNGRFGWRFNRYGAVEAQGEWNGDASLSGGAGDATTVAATVNLKWIVPAGRFEPYLVGGVGAFWAWADGVPGNRLSTTNPDVVLRGGLGIQFHVTEWLALVTEGGYIYPVDRLSDYQQGSVSFGVQLQY